MSHDLRDDLLKLSVAEQLELVQELWDSIAGAAVRVSKRLGFEGR